MVQNKQRRRKAARLLGDVVNKHYAIDVSTYNNTAVILISQEASKKSHILEAGPFINISIYTNSLIRGPLNIPVSQRGKALL